ncbi:hypothetical protein CDAR_580791 [Caerostris darwini]|uniref:Peptidase A2 domain-containing protein n=1 Tax=Caerostris darwini TaxID=1538125 RepID=A0AAV4RJ92_9ARAC|nr:hypothetical protein CDAR_580791 [Caerostris darwini]
MHEKEYVFKSRPQPPLSEPTGYNKETNSPGFRNECFTTGSYNNKYCGYTQWRRPMQKDNKCLVGNQNSHFARDCPKQNYKFNRINRQQNFKWRGEGIERNEGSRVYRRDHSLMTANESGRTLVSSYIKTARINKCPLEFEALIDTGSDSVISLIEKNFDLEVYQTMSVDEQVLIQRGDPEMDKIISIFKKGKFERHKDWDLIMKELDRNLNNALNKTNNKNPFQMLHGYSPRFNEGILRKQADESAEG